MADSNKGGHCPAQKRESDKAIDALDWRTVRGSLKYAVPESVDLRSGSKDR